MRRLLLFTYVSSIIFALASCASNPYAKTNKVYKKQAKLYGKQLSKFPPRETYNDSALIYGKYRVGTTNFNLRRPNYVIIHHTAQDSAAQTLRTFTLPRTQVSAHYVIDDNGEIYHMLNNHFRAWHGGVGQWGSDTDLNSASIGIELDNNGSERFSEAQINSLLSLLKILKEEYKIPTANFIGHSDIAPSRKVDPSIEFPWKKLAEEGYGYWYDEEVVDNLKMENEFFPPYPLTIGFNPMLTQKIRFLDKLIFPEVVPSDFDYEEALKIIGYDTSDLDSAIKAFKIHFIKEDVENPLLNEQQLKILYNLYKKYL